MTMPLQTSALRIARNLRETEGKFDEALLAAAKLMQEMLIARQSPEVQMHAGQKAIVRLAAAMQAVVGGSNNVFRVHDDLVEINKTYGYFDEEGVSEESGLLDSVDVRQAA